MAYLVPTVHPAALLRGGHPIADVIRMDLAKAHRLTMEPPRQVENIVVVHPANPAGVTESVRIGLAWLERWISLRCPVAVDVETSSLNYFNCKLYSIALSGCDGENTAVAFTLMDLRTLPWDAELAMLDALRRLLADPQIVKLFHNAPYDYAVLHCKNLPVHGPIEDTQGFAHLFQPDIPKDLGFIGHTWLDVEPWKLNHSGEKQAYTKDVIELLVYNAKDALNTMKLRAPLLAALADRCGSPDVIFYQNAFAQLAARMELVGLPMDLDIRRKVGAEQLARLEELRYRMREYLKWPDFNPMNKNHAVAALYDKKYVGLMPTAWTPKTKQPSTKYEHIIDHMEHVFVKDFVEYVESHHAYATQYREAPEKSSDPGPGAYTRAMQEDGRLHAKWNPTGQKGSRFSSEPNVQNQRKKDRVFFRAPYGRVFVGADKDQLELRLAAVLSGVREILDEVAKPDGDPHRLAAINIYGKGFLERSKEEQKRMRDAIKTTVYASLYRAGVKTVHKSIRKKKFLDHALRASLTLDVVGHIYHSYFGKYVEIPAWHDRNYDLAQTQGYLEIQPLGRRRYFPVQPPPYTEVANWPIQTTGSDIVGMEMVLVQDELDRRFHGDASIVLHGHDALYIECAERHAEEVCGIVNRLFGATRVEGPAGPVLLTASAEICKDLKFDKKDVWVPKAA
jgi:DNA polymerase-1